MASKKKAAVKLTAADETLLALAIKTFHGGDPLYATQEAMKTLLEWSEGPLVESNPAMTDPANPAKIAFRATPLGISMNQPAGAAPATQTQAEPQTGNTQVGAETVASDFEIEEGIEIPALKRGGRVGSGRRYPFETMGLKASFFIPKTEENPKPSKRIASVVSHASKTLAPKKFKVQAVNEIGGKGEGARVWRVE